MLPQAEYAEIRLARRRPLNSRINMPKAARNSALAQESAVVRTRWRGQRRAAPPGEALPTGGDLRQAARVVGPLAGIERRTPILLLTALSLALCCLIFPGVGWWPLAYVCLVPWLVCVCTAARARFMYAASYVFGLGFFLVNIYWMQYVTWPGYVALSAYMAVYFPLAAWPIRHLYRQRGAPLAIVAPIVWIATEYLRSTAFSGFPWLLLAHTQYKFLTLIQISDLVGAYGVSFVVVMVNGWITDLLIQPIVLGVAPANSRWGQPSARTGAGRKIRLPLGSAATLLVVAGTLVYGVATRSERGLEKGPRIAMVQHDLPLSIDTEDGEQLYWNTILDMHLALATQAAAQKPDLIVLPETAMRGSINPDFLALGTDDLGKILEHRFPPGTTVRQLESYRDHGREVYDNFQSLSTATGIWIVLGASAIEWKPIEVPPRVDAYNSAFLIVPGEKEPAARYDKQHLVVFSELVPCRFSYPWLYNWLNRLTPWGRDGRHHTLTPGEEYTVFEFESGEGRRFRTGTPICYEEIIPYINRYFVRGPNPRPERKNIDLLLSISNDGWFLHSTELEQHLAAAVFRAVENRISIARSVNTGISGLVYPNGKIHSRVRLSDEKIAKLDGVETALRRVHESLQNLGRVRGDARSFGAGKLESGRILSGELRPALEAMGPEFRFMEERLSRLRANVAAKPVAGIDTIEIAIGQVERDQATIERWRRRPWTAPGYAVDAALLDERVTLYTRWGDWFAIGTVAISALMWLDWLQRRLRRKTLVETA